MGRYSTQRNFSAWLGKNWRLVGAACCVTFILFLLYRWNPWSSPAAEIAISKGKKVYFDDSTKNLPTLQKFQAPKTLEPSNDVESKLEPQYYAYNKPPDLKQEYYGGPQAEFAYKQENLPVKQYYYENEILPQKGDLDSDSVAKVVVEVHMESRCPDTTNFIHNQLWPAWTQIKSIVDLKFIPFGKADCVSKPGDDFACRCQHLEKECVLNQLMNCVMEDHPTPEEYLPIVRCLQGNDMSKANECLTAASLTPGTYVSCAQGKKGRQLHARAGQKTKALRPGMHYVPWVLINGVREERALSGLKNIVCEKYKGTKPEACSSTQ